MESTWHFYARRILWTLLSLHDINTSDYVTIIFSGLEVHKSKEIIKYFLDIPRGSGASIEIINSLLLARGIKMTGQVHVLIANFTKRDELTACELHVAAPLEGRLENLISVNETNSEK